jgi:hypothetical protein
MTGMGILRHAVLLSAFLTCAGACSKPGAQPGSKSPDGARQDHDTKDAGELAVLVPLLGYWAMLGPGGGEPAREPSRWYRHAASSTCFPLDSGSFSAKHHEVYGPGDESVTLWSDELGTLVTLYTYPAQGTVEQDFGSAFRDMQRTCGGRLGASSTLGKRPIGACAHASEGGFQLIEQVLVFHEGSWSHKARFTYPEPLLDRAYSPSMALVNAAFRPCAQGEQLRAWEQELPATVSVSVAR